MFFLFCLLTICLMVLWSLVLDPWSLIPGHWSLVIGHWSLVPGHWFLVIGPWSLVPSHWSLVIGSWWFVCGSWSLVRDPLVIGHWSLVIGPWSFASWFERSFAAPSALPTALALTSRSALPSYSLDQWPMTRDHGPMTRDQWPRTNDQWPGTTDQWPKTNDQGQMTRDQGPMTNDQGPMTRDQWPGTNNKWPGTNGQGPMTRDQWPGTNGHWSVVPGPWSLVIGHWSREYERRAERLVSASVVGRAEGVTNDRSNHEANNLVFGAGTRPRSMMNDVLLNLVHQETLNNQLGRTGTTFCYLLAIVCQVPVTRKIRRRGNGRFIAALKSAIFVDNSQEAQLIQPSVVAFFHVLVVYNAVATSSQPPAVLLLTNQIWISLFARWAVQKVKSAFDWSIAVQFGINLHSWYIALHTRI